MAQATMNNYDENIDDTKNPFNKTIETAVGRTIDTMHIYEVRDKSKQAIPELYFCISSLTKGSKDEKESAIKILEKYAKKDYTEAQYILGQHYHLHKNDDSTAIFWHTKAAQNGHTRSQICLSYLLIEQHKYAEAIEYLKMASTNKAAIAELSYIMSQLYSEGNGVKQNKEKSLALLKKSANLDNTCALYELGHIYIENKEYQKAIECYKKSAELGDACGAYNYAVCYIKGEGVEKDNQQALKIIDDFIKDNGESTILIDLKATINSIMQEGSAEQTESIPATPLAERVYLVPLKTWPYLVTGILGCAFGLIFLLVSLFYLKTSTAYFLGALLLICGIIGFASMPGVKRRNKRNEESKKFPVHAILLTDDSFVIVTDKMCDVEFDKIKKISYKKDTYMFKTGFAVGTIIIQTSDNIYKISNIDNVFSVYSTLNQILDKHLQKKL